MSWFGTRSGWWPWLTLFLAALALRYAVLVRYEADYPLADTPVIDERSYDQWAQSLAAGDWIGQEVFFQEPLYPYFVGAVYALAGHEPPARDVLRRVQVGLGALTAVLVGLLAARAFGRPAGLWAGVLLALHGPALILPAWLLKPNLFLPLLAALSLGLLRVLGSDRQEPLRVFVGCGLLAGLGALLRGNMLLLLPWLCLAPGLAALVRGSLRSRPWVRQGGALALGVACVLLPVALRNQAVGGVFVLTTSGAGTNVYGGNNLDNPYGRATEFDWVRGIPEFEAGDWRREAERRTGGPLDPSEVSRFWLGETWRSIQLHPVTHARILWNKLRLTLAGYEVPDNHSYDWDRARLGWFAAWPSDWRLLGSLGLAGILLWLFGAHRGAAGWVLLATFLLYLATIVATVTSDRVRLALAVPLLPFAGLWLTRIPDLWRGGLRERSGLAASLCLGALPVLWLPLDQGQRRQDLDKREFNLAVYLLAGTGGPEAAQPIAESLAARYPESSRVATLLSEVEARRGFAGLDSSDPAQTQASQALITSALQRLGQVVARPTTNPRERFRARSLAGWIQLQLRRGDAAARHFRAALEFDDESRELRAGLASALELAAAQAGDQAAAAILSEEASALRAALAQEAQAVQIAPGSGAD